MLARPTIDRSSSKHHKSVRDRAPIQSQKIAVHNQWTPLKIRSLKSKIYRWIGKLKRKDCHRFLPIFPPPNFNKFSFSIIALHGFDRRINWSCMIWSFWDNRWFHFIGVMFWYLGDELWRKLWRKLAGKFGGPFSMVGVGENPDLLWFIWFGFIHKNDQFYQVFTAFPKKGHHIWMTPNQSSKSEDFVFLYQYHWESDNYLKLLKLLKLWLTWRYNWKIWLFKCIQYSWEMEGKTRHIAKLIFFDFPIGIH